MIIIWGSRTRRHILGALTDEQCPACSYPELQLISSRRWFTFFFAPIFPTSKKKYYLECAACGKCFKIKDEVIAELLNAEEPTTPESNIFS